MTQTDEYKEGDYVKIKYYDHGGVYLIGKVVDFLGGGGGHVCVISNKTEYWCDMETEVVGLATQDEIMMWVLEN